MDRFKKIVEEGRELTIGKKVVLPAQVPRIDLEVKRLYICAKARTIAYPKDTQLPLELDYDGEGVVYGEAIVLWTRNSVSGSCVGYIIKSLDD
jgi:hypothetical protein